MRYEPSQILALLSDGRISLTEAERLLARTVVAASLSRTLRAWTPSAALAAVLVIQNLGALRSSFEFLTLRAVEFAQLNSFHTLINR
jgi:hypothetical protein